jgi:hypothetical protein
LISSYWCWILRCSFDHISLGLQAFECIRASDNRSTELQWVNKSFMSFVVAGVSGPVSLIISFLLFRSLDITAFYPCSTSQVYTSVAPTIAALPIYLHQTVVAALCLDYDSLAT